jgi:hypothetical protein
MGSVEFLRGILSKSKDYVEGKIDSSKLDIEEKMMMNHLAELIKRKVPAHIHTSNMPDEINAALAVTINPTESIGVGERVGSIEPGKDGDLTILSRHPLKAKSTVSTVLIDEVVYARDRHCSEPNGNRSKQKKGHLCRGSNSIYLDDRFRPESSRGVPKFLLGFGCQSHVPWSPLDHAIRCPQNYLRK